MKDWNSQKWFQARQITNPVQPAAVLTKTSTGTWRSQMMGFSEQLAHEIQGDEFQPYILLPSRQHIELLLHLIFIFDLSTNVLYASHITSSKQIAERFYCWFFQPFFVLGFTQRILIHFNQFMELGVVVLESYLSVVFWRASFYFICILVSEILQDFCLLHHVHVN